MLRADSERGDEEPGFDGDDESECDGVDSPSACTGRRMVIAAFSA